MYLIPHVGFQLPHQRLHEPLLSHGASRQTDQFPSLHQNRSDTGYVSVWRLEELWKCQGCGGSVSMMRKYLPLAITQMTQSCSGIVPPEYALQPPVDQGSISLRV